MTVSCKYTSPQRATSHPVGAELSPIPKATKSEERDETNPQKSKSRKKCKSLAMQKWYELLSRIANLQKNDAIDQNTYVIIGRAIKNVPPT